MDIVENTLNLRCPRCRKVFVDFDGCFALTCSVTTCRAGFCAWCLKDSGPNPHAHVSACPEGYGMHGSLDAFNAHHRRRKERIVRELVAQESTEVQRHVHRLLEKDLRDLGITLLPISSKRPTTIVRWTFSMYRGKFPLRLFDP